MRIFDELDKLFRYFLSGIITIFVCITYFSESAISKFFVTGKASLSVFVGHWQMVLLLALAIGAVIYVINRYVVITLIDYIFFCCGCGAISADGNISLDNYRQRLAEFLEKRFNPDIFRPELSKHLHMRRAHGHFLLFLSEVCFAIGIWGNFSDSVPLFWNNFYVNIGLILFAFFLLQIIVAEGIEREITKKWEANMNTRTIDENFKIELSFTGKNDSWSYRGKIFDESIHKKSVKKDECISGGNVPKLESMEKAIDDARIKILDVIKRWETNEK